MKIRVFFLLLLMLAPTASQSNFFGKVIAKSLRTDGVTVDSTYFKGSIFGPSSTHCTNISDFQNVACDFHGTITNHFKSRTITQVIVNLSTYGCPDKCTLYEEDRISLLRLNQEIPPGTKKTFRVDADYNRTPDAVRVFSVVKVKGY